VANLGAGDGMLNRIGSLLNIYCYYYGAGVSVRRVLRPTMKTRYDKIRLQNGVLSAASKRICSCGLWFGIRILEIIYVTVKNTQRWNRAQKVFRSKLHRPAKSSRLILNSSLECSKLMVGYVKLRLCIGPSLPINFNTKTTFSAPW
jgi:hypothetical protein